MKARFYYDRHNDTIAGEVKNRLNASPIALTAETAQSPRAVGDTLEALIADMFKDILGDWCVDYSKDFARRSMADLAFTDKDGIHSIIDVKTHRENTDFNMPNLTSVQRLAKLYESDKDVFAIMMVNYTISTDNTVAVSQVSFNPIEFFAWECLTIGALGWGQIQIADSNTITINHGYSRKQWMLGLCDAIERFYPKEIAKIHDRLNYFAEVRTLWQNKDDIWKKG